MTKRESFIKIVKNEIFDRPDIWAENYPDIYSDAEVYFNAMLESADKEKSAFTENGKKVLKFMQEHFDEYGNLFKAKDMGEQLGISSRTVSGGMRKLVTDGYVEKIGSAPVIYAITEKGKTTIIESDPSEEEN